MPLCKYDLACTRPGCLYRQSDRGQQGWPAASNTVCMPYLAGMCAFGKGCRNRHPGKQEADMMLAKFAKQPCRSGRACQIPGCLFWHPE